MKKFEYKSVLNPNTAVLNALGIEGWELVAIASDSLFYLKRELNYGE